MGTESVQAVGGMSLWLVGYAVRSEAATVVVVEADSERQAKEAAVSLEGPGFAKYAQRAADEDGHMTVEPIRPGLQMVIDAPH